MTKEMYESIVAYIAKGKEGKSVADITGRGIYALEAVKLLAAEVWEMQQEIDQLKQKS